MFCIVWKIQEHLEIVEFIRQSIEDSPDPRMHRAESLTEPRNHTNSYWTCDTSGNQDDEAPLARMRML